MANALFEMEKVCRDCGEAKPLDAFSAHTGTRDGKRSYCKPCQTARTQRYLERDPEARRRWWLKHKYGLTIDEFNALMGMQGSACAICRVALNLDGGTTPGGFQACVDHDHATGRVRGILCFNCNTVLGKVHDRPEVLRAAADYLEGGQ